MGQSELVMRPRPTRDRLVSFLEAQGRHLSKIVTTAKMQKLIRLIASSP